MDKPTIDKLRKKASYYRGLRKTKVEAELVEALVRNDVDEALALAQSTSKRARTLVAEAAERKADQKPYLDVLAHALRAHAYALKTVRQFAEAGNLLKESLALYEHLENVPGLIDCHQLVHLLHRDQGQYQQALDYLDRAIAIAKHAAYDNKNAELHGERGTLLALLGHHEEAIAAFDLGIELAALKQKHQTHILLLVNCGSFHQRSDNYSKAEALFNRALELEAEHKLLVAIDHVSIIWSSIQISRINGNLAAVFKTVEQGIKVSAASKLTFEFAQFKLFKAQMHLLCANYAESRHVLQEIYTLDEFKQNELVAAKYWSLRAHLANVVGDKHSAAEAVQRTIKLLDKQQLSKGRVGLEVMGIVRTLVGVDKIEIKLDTFVDRVNAIITANQHVATSVQLAGAQYIVGILLEHIGNRDAAHNVFREVLRECRKRNWPLNLTRALMAMGRVNDVHEDRTFSIGCLEEALELNRLTGLREWELQTLKELAHIHKEAGNTAKALNYLESFAALQAELFQPDVIFTIWRDLRKAEAQEQSSKSVQQTKQIAELQKRHDSLKRVLDTRETHIKHLRDSLLNIHEQLKLVDKESKADYLQRILDLRTTIPSLAEGSGWQEFESEVSESDEAFLKRLSQLYPRLTATERKICSLIRLNNTSKDLARLLNIAPRSVQSHRYRIRKKMELGTEVDLNAYILDI